MKKIWDLRVWSLVMVCVLGCALAMQAQGEDGPPPWPFGDPPPPASNVGDTGTFADYVRVEGSMELVNGIVFGGAVRGSLVLDPFFLRSRTDVAIFPGFGLLETIEAGFGSDWFSLRAEASADLVPWNSPGITIGADVTPPAWIFGDTPIFKIETRFGANAHYYYLGWFGDVTGMLDIQAGFRLDAADAPVDVIAGLLIDGRQQIPMGFGAFDLIGSLEAKTALPFLSTDDIRAQGRARGMVFVLPSTGVLGDLRLDWNSPQFHAYVLLGYGTYGLLFELGASIAWIWGL